MRRAPGIMPPPRWWMTSHVRGPCNDHLIRRYRRLSLRPGRGSRRGTQDKPGLAEASEENSDETPDRYWTRLQKVTVDDVRGVPFCGMGAFVGTGTTQRAHVYSAKLPVDPEAYKSIDPARLAKELEVDMVAVNHGRFWMFDQLNMLGGELQDFHGVEMRWAGDMTGAEMIGPVPVCILAQHHPSHHRVGLPRRPARAASARPRRSDLGPAGVHQGRRTEPHRRQPRPAGRHVQGAAGRLDIRDQGADQGPLARHARAGGWAAIVRDEFHCTYQGCGYGADTNANYIP